MDYEIFNGKSFQDLCKDIYSNQLRRKDQIEQLINDLRKMCTKVDDLPMVIPFIKDYINAANVNDEHLIRLAAIIQKLMVADSDAKVAGGNSFLSEEDRKNIMSEIEAIQTIQNTDTPLINVIEKSE